VGYFPLRARGYGVVLHHGGILRGHGLVAGPGHLDQQATVVAFTVVEDLVHFARMAVAAGPMGPYGLVQGGVKRWLARGARRRAHEVHNVLPAVLALDIEDCRWPLDADEAEGALGPVAQLSSLAVVMTLKGKPADLQLSGLGPGVRIVIPLVALLRCRQGLPDPWEKAHSARQKRGLLHFFGVSASLRSFRVPARPRQVLNGPTGHPQGVHQLQRGDLGRGVRLRDIRQRQRRQELVLRRGVLGVVVVEDAPHCTVEMIACPFVCGRDGVVIFASTDKRLHTWCQNCTVNWGPLSDRTRSGGS